MSIILWFLALFDLIAIVSAIIAIILDDQATAKFASCLYFVLTLAMAMIVLFYHFPHFN